MVSSVVLMSVPARKPIMYCIRKDQKVLCNGLDVSTIYEIEVIILLDVDRSSFPPTLMMILKILNNVMLVEVYLKGHHPARDPSKPHTY